MKLFGMPGKYRDAAPEKFGQEMGALCCGGHDRDETIKALLKEDAIGEILANSKSAKEKLWLDLSIIRLFIMRMYLGELHSLGRLGNEYERNFSTVIAGFYKHFWGCLKKHRGQHSLKDILKNDKERRQVRTLASLSGDREYLFEGAQPNPKMELYPIAEAIVEERMGDYRKKYQKVVSFDWNEPENRRGPWVGLAETLFCHISGRPEAECVEETLLAINLHLRQFGMSCIKRLSSL